MRAAQGRASGGTSSPLQGCAATAAAAGAGSAGGEVAADLLIEAGAVLVTSLDLATTMNQVARLTVPRLADLCVIDLRADDGAIEEVAVAANDDQLARGLERLRGRFPLDPQGDHPVARVIRSGEPELLKEMSSSLLRSFAQGSEHAAFMIEHGYRSAVVAPLPARARTLGALSVLRLGESAPYREQDVELVCELARRAALAIDNARLFSELRGVEQRLQAVLGNLAEAITMEDDSGHVVFANQAAADLLRVASPEEVTAARPGELLERFLIIDEQGRELAPPDMPGRRLFAGEQPAALLVKSVVRATGEERWLVVRASPASDPVSARVLYAVTVFEDITGVKRAELAETFMAEASRVLSSSLQYTATLPQVARLAVPLIADWCAFDLLSEHGEIERIALHHSDPRKLELLERLSRDYPPRLHEPTGIADVLRSGEPRIYTDISSDSLARYARDDEHLTLLREIGTTGVIVVPIAGATREAIGTVTLGSPANRVLGGGDLGVCARLGRRTGTAVERSRIYRERSRIAHVLQRALLPDSLPEIPGAEVRASYSAAGELNEVGGDFYDVFDYDPGRWMLVIGDVVGKGPRAAGVTALARHTLRAAAISGQDTAEMLHTLHLALRRQPPGADLCTVALVTMRLSGAGAKLHLALAGHQPPFVINREGAARQVGRPGTVLGVIDPISVSEEEVALSAGETLLMYTDGVTDAGSPQDALGEQGLRSLCRRAPELSLEELLELVQRTALERARGSLHDDIALLALRVRSGASETGVDSAR